MKSNDELKAEMDVMWWQTIEPKKNERANSLKEIKCLLKEISFTAGELKGSLSDGRKVKR